MGEAVHPSIPQGERRGCAGAEFVLLEEGRFDIFRELKPVVIEIGSPFTLRYLRANGEGAPALSLSYWGMWDSISSGT